MIRFCTLLLLLNHAQGHAGEKLMVDTGAYPSPFGANVLLFDPTMDTAGMQATLDALHEQQANDEFSERRYALLFKPGAYDLDVTVDYYVQASGLGQVPSDVTIHGTVQSISTTTRNRVTIMFWRSAENFLVVPRATTRPVFWAVSQAAPYRRMHIQGDLQFDLGGWASGGLLANSIVEGTAGLTSGQQWFTRNSTVQGWRGGAWNRTFLGTEGSPPSNWPETPVTVVDRTPVIREKPFLTIDADGEFSVFVPALQHDTRGVSWRSGNEAGVHLPLADFHLAFPAKDTAASINAALGAGRHVLLTPGIYALEDALRISRPGTVVMGLGLATLVPQTGQPAVETADVDGVIIASLMVDAGPEPSPHLIRIGEPGASRDHAADPTSAHDLFCRVGGAIAGSAGTCLEINSNHVIVDHTWLWRADHGAGAKWTVNRADHGLIVNGDDVTSYGLFNEHFQAYQTLWNGERGRVYFYQSEIPYDPPSPSAWTSGKRPGFASYKVADDVETHQAFGLGIYSFFGVRSKQDKGVRLGTAIEAPDRPGVSFSHISTFSGGFGGIDHVINDRGPATSSGELRFYDGHDLQD